MYFRIIYFVIISPWKRAGHFIWKNLNPMRCAKFDWNWPSGSGEDFKISSIYIRHFVIISLWKRAKPFICTYLNPLNLSKDALCQVWLKLVQWFWRKRWKCEKFTTTPTTTDNGQNFDQVSWKDILNRAKPRFLPSLRLSNMMEQNLGEYE